MLAKILLLSMTLLLLSPGSSGAATIEGVDFPARVESGETTLYLQGAALLRYRVVFKAYAAALYLGEGVVRDSVLADVPRRLEIEYFWQIPAEGFIRATNDGIANNVDSSTLDALRVRIERFNALYSDVKPGDRYTVTYLPGQGTALALNGRIRGVVEGADFAAALFSIWLGEVPFDEKLKRGLLDASS